MNKKVLLGALFSTVMSTSAAVNITVNSEAGRKAISPALYGLNNMVGGSSDDSVAAFLKEAGVRIVRENGGNNSTKYNWKNGLSSHPDWYNNVYGNNWDSQAQTIQQKLPNMMGLFAFSLLGWVADNANNNFDDWTYNQSAWWEGTGQNLAGGGTAASSGTKAAVEGDYTKYLRAWPADSAVGILDYWFGASGLALDSTRFRYWNMDNEVDIWNGTHDDVVKSAMDAEVFMQKYIAVAMAARAKFPGIKLVGPVFTNEWQWYNWQSAITYKGTKYCWMEFFIKRLAEKQDSTGVRLLDVLDFHFYPSLDGSSASEATTIAQLHRIWFDTTWVYPDANGVKNVSGSWNNNLNKEYVWERCRVWLEKYMGTNHGVNFGITEMGAVSGSPSLISVWYASHLGTFADHGVEVFTPWDWRVGQWEVLHLFSRYAKSTRVESTSSLDSLVSAYSSLSAGGDSLVVVLVNRDQSNSQTANVTLSGFSASSSATTLRLANLPTTESFVSHTSNALVAGTATVSNGALSLTLPKLSVTAVTLVGKSNTVVANPVRLLSSMGRILVRPGSVMVSYDASVAGATLKLYDMHGSLVRNESVPAGSSQLAVSTVGLPAGRYFAAATGSVARSVLVP